MPTENSEQVKDEIQRGLLFLSTISQNGTVYSAIFPVLNKLQNQLETENRMQTAATDTAHAKNDHHPCSQDYESIIIAIHKTMCEEKFICIYEKPNSVPGFAPAVRGKAPSVSQRLENRC